MDERDKRMPEALIWDLDGTLIDSLPDLHQVLNLLLGESGHGPIPMAQVKPMIGDGAARFIERGFAAASGEQLSVDQVSRLMPRFLDLYGSVPTSESHLFEGARETLNVLHRAGVKQAICTNKPKPVADQVVADLGLANIFQSVVGGGPDSPRKPDPEPLLRAVSEMGADLANCLMIGDSEVDLQTARNAGIPVGMVTFGYARSPAADLGADFLIDRLADVPGLLIGRCRNNAALRR